MLYLARHADVLYLTRHLVFESSKRALFVLEGCQSLSAFPSLSPPLKRFSTLLRTCISCVVLLALTPLAIILAYRRSFTLLPALALATLVVTDD